MLIFANFFEAIAVVLDYALSIYMWIVIAGAVLSWVSPDPYNPIVRFINTATEPVFYQIRKRLPVSFGTLFISYYCNSCYYFSSNICCAEPSRAGTLNSIMQ